jgi:hypothetical protein
MSLTDEIESIADHVVPEKLDRFRQHIDAAWIEEALAATGTASVRRRRLPADQVVWLVLGMGLLRNESIERIVHRLDLALPDAGNTTVARSGITQSRRRLGSAPLEYLFATTADRWGHSSAVKHAWRGLSLYGVDGTTMRVPDSPENWKVFGGPSGAGERGSSGYPLLRMVTVMALRSHLLVAARFGEYRNGEVPLAENFWSELPDDSLSVLDRGFLGSSALTQLARSGENKHWLVPAKSTTQIRVIKKLGRDDALVEIVLSDSTRKNHPELPLVWIARAITYKKRGFPKRTLLTSLGNHESYPRRELIDIYHERWELELGYDEIKTHLLDRQEAIRSRTPDGVNQEMWGILIAYNLVRLEMERAADEAKVEPNRISFVNAVALIRYAWLSASLEPAVPAKIPAALLDVRAQLKLLLLPPRRPERRAPREVKIKMSNYRRKTPTGKGRK